MNQQEKLKAHVIGMCVKGKMTVREGAERLHLSERQVKNLKARHKIGGAASMLHGNCGRQPSHTLTPEVRQRILEIRGMPIYEQANFTHFCEILGEKHDIKISYTALRTLLVSSGTALSHSNESCADSNTRQLIQSTICGWYRRGVK